MTLPRSLQVGEAAAHRRAMARALLTQAAPLVADATEQGLADLSHAARILFGLGHQFRHTEVKKVGFSCTSERVKERESDLSRCRLADQTGLEWFGELLRLDSIWVVMIYYDYNVI